MSKEEKISKALKRLASGEDSVTWCNHLITKEPGIKAGILTEKGFKFTFSCLGGSVFELLVAYPPSGKPWTKPDTYIKNPTTYLSAVELSKLTKAIVKFKLGYEITVQETYIMYVNGSEVKEAIFDKGPVGGMKYPREDMCQNRFTNKEAAKSGKRAFEKYYKAYVETKQSHEGNIQDRIRGDY